MSGISYIYRIRESTALLNKLFVIWYIHFHAHKILTRSLITIGIHSIYFELKSHLWQKFLVLILQKQWYFSMSQIGVNNMIANRVARGKTHPLSKNAYIFLYKIRWELAMGVNYSSVSWVNNMLDIYSLKEWINHKFKNSKILFLALLPHTWGKTPFSLGQIALRGRFAPPQRRLAPCNTNREVTTNRGKITGITDILQI